MERVERRPDGTRVVHVATADETAAACPGCGVVSTSVKEHVTTSPKDIPYGWRRHRGALAQDPLALLGGLLPEVLVHRGHRADPGAGAHHYAVAHPDRGGDRRRRPCGGRGRRHPWRCRGRPRTGRLSPTPRHCWPNPSRWAVLGIDETRRGKPRWQQCADTGRWVRIDPWDTGFVDLSGDQGLLGQREGRTCAAVIDWLSERSEQFRVEHRVRRDRPGRGLRDGDPHARVVTECDGRGRSLPPGEVSQRCADQGAPPGHLGSARSARPAGSTRNGLTGDGCCWRENACRTSASRKCGTRSWPRTTPARSCRRGSPRKNYAPCSQPCAPAATHT